MDAFQSVRRVCGAVGMWVQTPWPWRWLLPPLVTAAAWFPLARWGHVVHWGQEGLRRLVPEAGSHLFVCLFPSAAEPGRGAASPRKKKEKETVQKGIMR